MKRKTPNVKFMTEAQLKKIIENNYQGDPAKGYGFDYGADLKEEIDQRLWELQGKKSEKQLVEYARCEKTEVKCEAWITHFKCLYCFNIEGFKSIKECKSGTYSPGTNKGKCKSCHNAYVRNYHRQKAASLYPDKYCYCDDCDSIFCKTRQKKLLECCPYCQSKNMVPY